MDDAIVISRVTKKYKNGKGIFNVSLDVKEGEVFGFLGPNGAGKTTTIRTLMDFMRPDSGSITILGNDANKTSVKVKNQVGYVPADRQMYSQLTGHQHLDLYRSFHRSNENTIAEKLDLDLNIPVKHQSSGNKQKLALVLALYGNPKLLIMDEPTLGLDPLLQQKIYEILAEYKLGGGTVFLSSHNLPEVEKICDRVGVIKDGRIIADKSMQDIRDMSIHVVSVITTERLAIPKNKFENIEVTSQHDNHILLKVKGDLNPLLSFIAKHKVQDIEINHASLEDIFMEYYK